jgi:hypothetical protein
MSKVGDAANALASDGSEAADNRARTEDGMSKVGDAAPADNVTDTGPEQVQGDANDSGDTAPVPVSSNSQSELETETQLAVAGDGTIAIAWIAFSATQPDGWIGYTFSKDGGATFTSMGRLLLPAGLAASDPALAVDAAGNFYLAALGVHFAGMGADYTRLFVAKAASGATMFSAPVEVTTPMALYDHPKIFVTAKGTVVLGFAQSPTSADAAPPTTSVGRVATSADGQTWQLGTIAGPPSVVFANLFWFCEGAGILYVTYLESTATAGYVALRTSTDEGVTWTSTAMAVSLPTERPAEMDPGCVASGSDVWIAYGTSSSPPPSDPNLLDPAHAISIAHSGDRGSMIGNRLTALDTSAGALGLLPVMVRESGGALDVIYLAGNSEGDTKGSVRYVRDSADAGFALSVLVDGPLTFTMKRNMATWLGDYIGAVASGTKLLVAYPLNASGTTHIFFRSMSLL